MSQPVSEGNDSADSGPLMQCGQSPVEAPRGAKAGTSSSSSASQPFQKPAYLLSAPIREGDKISERKMKREAIRAFEINIGIENMQGMKRRLQTEPNYVPAGWKFGM